LSTNNTNKEGSADADLAAKITDPFVLFVLFVDTPYPPATNLAPSE